MSILSKKVSYFSSVKATARGVEMNLLTILESNKHRQRIIDLRSRNKPAQKQLKENLPCYTVAGTFKRRCDYAIIQLSGLAAVDLDSAEDYDVIYLLNELRKIPSIAYAGLSCSGRRLFCIVPFLHPNKYREHYERLIQSFDDYGLPMGDVCHKTISQPRFVSWNDHDTQFFNHDAKPYDLLPPDRILHTIKRSPKHYGNTVPENPFVWCNEQLNKNHLFSKGTRHDFIVHLARYCNIKGLSEQDTLQGCLTYVQPDFNKSEIGNIVKHIYKAQADSHNKLPFAEKHRTYLSDSLGEIPVDVELKEGSVPLSEDSMEIHPQNRTHENWDQQIKELQTFFKSVALPIEPIQLNAATEITDVAQFIAGHVATVKAQNGKYTFLPFLERLIQVKEFLLSRR